MRPFLRWAGSKRLLLPKIAAYWNNKYERYVEPFAGSASLFFHLAPRRAVLADINAELINCLHMVAKHPAVIYKQFLMLPENRLVYNTLRSIEPHELTETDRAARFFYLNRYCFNGIYRTNREGHFNVPFSGRRCATPPTYREMLHASRLLRNATISCGDFEQVLLRHACAGDFVYLDPPYATTARRVFRQYHPDSFSANDLPRLTSVLSAIDRRGAAFVLSYAYCPEALRAFKRWNLEKVFALRNVSGFVSKRRKAAEIIVSNIAS
jgi:DNA adenine methylase